MRAIQNKQDRAVPTTQGQSGKPRKVAEWQSERLTGLGGIPRVRFRRLKSNEWVMLGDYIKDGDSSYRPWEGPNGFRADSFVKKVYRPEPTDHQ